MARFYLDENFTLHVVDPLRNLGHTVLTSVDVGASGSWDDEQFFIAVQQKAILVSFNIKDFRLLHAAWRSWSRHWGVERPHYGVILLQQPQPPRSPESLAQELHEVVTRFEMQDQAIEWRSQTGWTPVTPYRLFNDLPPSADA